MRVIKEGVVYRIETGTFRVWPSAGRSIRTLWPVVQCTRKQSAHAQTKVLFHNRLHNNEGHRPQRKYQALQFYEYIFQ